jgi:hypothetical protein
MDDGAADGLEEGNEEGPDDGYKDGSVVFAAAGFMDGADIGVGAGAGVFHTFSS